MLNTIENRFKKLFARLGFLLLGGGFYIGSTPLVVVGSVIVLIYATDQYLEWKEYKEDKL